MVVVVVVREGEREGERVRSESKDEERENEEREWSTGRHFRHFPETGKGKSRWRKKKSKVMERGERERVPVGVR